MLNIWNLFKTDLPCNSIIGNRYEIHIENEYAIIKRLNDEMIFRITGEAFSFIINHGEEKVCEYLDGLSIPEKKDKVSQKKILNLKLKTDNVQIPKYICWMPFVVMSIIVFLIIEFYLRINGLKVIDCEKRILYFLFLILNIIVHELGHITFCISAGRKVKALGVKLNYFIPMFYVDTSDICMASKKQKLLTSLGGVYFNSLMGIILIVIGYITKNNFLQSLSCISFFFVISNLIPFIKLDGYYIMSDILGVSRLEKTAKTAFQKTILKKITGNTIQKILSIYYVLAVMFKICLCVAVVITVAKYFEIDVFSLLKSCLS